MSQDDMFGQSLEVARSRYFEDAVGPKGTTCPCCDRFGKIYNRRHNKSMAESLVWLFQMHIKNPNGYVDIGTNAPRYVLKNGGSLASNRWWGLVERDKKEDNDAAKHTSGRWRLTSKGIAFVKDEIVVPSHVCTYNKDAISFSATMTDISGSLGRPFNYRQLMQGI